MNKTKIEWCSHTWNPIVGCSACSIGCEHCYAAAISNRFNLPWRTPVFLPNRLREPMGLKTPSKIFVCSMSDLGHPGVKQEWRQEIYATMRACPQHTFLILTKRPGRWMGKLPWPVWAGVTIESQEYVRRWDRLREYCDNQILFVSVEPMLGPVSFKKKPAPDWVIAGPETGPGARPCKAEWIDSLAYESQCFFDKRKTGWIRREFPSVRKLTEAKT